MTKVSILVKCNRCETQLIKQWGQPRRTRFKCAHKDPKLSADYSLDFLKVFPKQSSYWKTTEKILDCP